MSLQQIFDELAAMPVVVEGEVVTVRNVAELPSTVAAGNLPLRLLMPFGDPQEGRETPITITPAALTIAIEWRITDLFLWKAAAQATTEQAAPVAVDYMDAYTDALAHLNLTSGVLTGITMRDRMMPYPAGGAASYFAVWVTLTVREIRKP